MNERTIQAIRKWIEKERRRPNRVQCPGCGSEVEEGSYCDVCSPPQRLDPRPVRERVQAALDKVDQGKAEREWRECHADLPDTQIHMSREERLEWFRGKMT